MAVAVMIDEDGAVAIRKHAFAHRAVDVSVRVGTTDVTGRLVPTPVPI
jgi:hypothetical protein